MTLLNLSQLRQVLDTHSHAGDFWLIDNREVVAMHYQPDGQFRAAEILGPQQSTAQQHRSHGS